MKREDVMREGREKGGEKVEGRNKKLRLTWYTG